MASRAATTGQLGRPPVGGDRQTSLGADDAAEEKQQEAMDEELIYGYGGNLAHTVQEVDAETGEAPRKEPRVDPRIPYVVQ